MLRLRLAIYAIALCALAFPTVASAGILRGRDPLSQRDEWGQLHQSKTLNEPDFAKREWWRLFYYNKSRTVLMEDPAYVGALQVALRRNGYYCGPIDGVYSAELTDAIAQMQKNLCMRVTGNLTVPIRRALFLP